MAKRKILLVGWDAADWKVVTPLVDVGKMPNVQRIIENGVMGNLGTLFPVLSPMLWTSIATGKRPFKHGIHGFSEPNPGSGGIRPITTLSRKTKALWNILNQNDLRSNVVGWWPSQPAEPINGVMVSNEFQQAVGAFDKSWPMRPGTIFPQWLEEKLQECRVHPEEIPGDVLQMFVPDAGKIDQTKDPRLFQLAKIVAECSGIQAAATAIIQDEPWDFMAVYFDGIDHFGHGFMRYHPPKQDWVSQEDYDLYHQVVNGAYQFHDYMLGVLMQLAGDDVTVVLMSDHGFHPDALRLRTTPNEPAGPAAEHRPFGIFATMGPGIKQDDLVFGAGLLDICPTILSMFDLPVGEDMDGRPLTSIFENEPEVEYIPSWDDVVGEDGQHPADMKIDAVDAQEAIDQLVALGYIEEPNANKELAVAETIRELRYNLARSYIDASLHHEGIAIFQELWEKWPDESRFGVHLFHSLIAVDNVEAAAEVLTEIKENKQRYASEAQGELQKLVTDYKEKDQTANDIPEKEQRRMRKLQARASFNTHAFAFLEGSLRHAQGDFEAAIEQLRKAEGVQVNSQPSLFEALGNAQLAMKRYDEAEAEFQRALVTDTINPSARLGLARAYLGQGQHQAAAEQALAAIGQRYHNPQAHFIAGRALARAGRINEAVASLKIALSQNPVFPAAHREMARLLQDNLGDWNTAAKHRKLAEQAKQRIAEWKGGLRKNDPKLALRSAFEIDGDLIEDEGTISDLSSAPPLEKSVVIVSGLPRSGTSMMMQMLAAGGLPILSDGKRVADESNPNGYFEFDEVGKLGRENSWLTRAEGQAVKIVAQLLPKLPLQLKLADESDHVMNYRVIMMNRPLGEIIGSQSAMLERLDKPGGELSEARLATTFQKQLRQVRKVLGHYRKSGRVLMLPVSYHETLKNPAAIAEKVNTFLNGGLDEEAMVERVDPSLHRVKR